MWFRVSYDEKNHFFKTYAPVWFQPMQATSLAQWIIFYLERSMWVQFNDCVKNEYCRHRDAMFISRDSKLVNIKNELLGYWKDFHEKCKDDQQLVAELEEELLSRTMKEAKVIGSLSTGMGFDIS
jgi:hypothetical protein